MNPERQLREACGCRIVIVGGGFTGAMMSVQLLRRADPEVSIVLVERTSLLGRGVAYGTQFDGHLLNVRANNMSAYPDDPDHFVNWAKQNYSSSVRPSHFLPRPAYGRYIASQLWEAAQSHAGKIRFVQDEALSLTRVSGVNKILLAGGQTIVADKVVLALGNFAPGDLRLPGKAPDSCRHVANPWSGTTRFDTSPDSSVLLVGSGLTAVDTAIELRARGFEGTIHILSRRGLLPQSHRIAAPFPAFWNCRSPRTVRGLLQLIRQQAKVAQTQGSDWRAVIDSLRPVTQEIWRTLPRTEQQRFLRHLRTYWDVHRHRIAGRVAEQLARQLRSGKIQRHAGRITDYRENAGGVEVTYRDRKSGMLANLCVGRVINCTGPESDYRRAGSPLLTDLIEKGLARPDGLSLGVDVADDGALVDAQGMPSDFLYALGPLRKGVLWESIAVPELRVQISNLAKLLSASCAMEDSCAEAGTRTEISAALYH